MLSCSEFESLVYTKTHGNSRVALATCPCSIAARSILGAIQVLPRSDNLDPSVICKRQQILVACHDQVGSASLSTFQNEVVLRVAADAGNPSHYNDSSTFLKKFA